MFKIKINTKMLLHSDWKVKKFDPKVTVFNSQSVSPIRSYENAVGGGKILSMKPRFISSGSYLLACNNPYRSMFNSAHSHGFDNTLVCNDDVVRESIEIAVKKYFLEQREQFKYQLVKDALADFRHEISLK